jgi:hypothetical protein
MATEATQTTTVSSPFLSPDAHIKQKTVGLIFSCIELNAKSLNEEDKYAFCTKTRDLAIMLERYTPKDNREEIKKWYIQLSQEIDKIKDSQQNLTEQQKVKLILDKKYRYSDEVHQHNMRILMNSPIIEVETEGELDLTDEEAIKIIRGGKRTDDGKIIAK